MLLPDDRDLLPDELRVLVPEDRDLLPDELRVLVPEDRDLLPDELRVLVPSLLPADLELGDVLLPVVVLLRVDVFDRVEVPWLDLLRVELEPLVVPLYEPVLVVLERPL